MAKLVIIRRTMIPMTRPSFQAEDIHQAMQPTNTTLTQFPKSKMRYCTYYLHVVFVHLFIQRPLCDNIKAMKNQGTKFRNMDRTGTLNTQCSHICILSSMDMEGGERYVCIA